MRKQIYQVTRYTQLSIVEVVMPSTARSRQVFSEHFNFEEYDLFLVLTETWFTENIMWTVSQLKKTNKKIIFIRTKADIAMEQEAAITKKRIEENRIISKIRQSASHVIHKNYSKSSIIHVVDTRNIFNWGGLALIDEILAWSESLTLRNSKKGRNTLKGGATLNPFTLNLPPISIKILQRKFEALSDRIWKISLLSVSSRIMFIGRVSSLLTG